MMERFTLLFLVLLTTCYAGPLTSTSTCYTSCQSDSSPYVVGKQYTFNYSGTTSTTVKGSFSEQAGLKISAVVQINPVLKCEMLMKLEDVVVEEADPSQVGKFVPSPEAQRFKTDLEANELRFSFENGKIKTICSKESDQEWIVNVKRGILSMVQNVKMEENREYSKTVEEDVSGKCPVTYKDFVNENNEYKYTKIKNLQECSNRQYIMSALQATPYRVDSSIQSVPLIEGKLECVNIFTSTWRIKKVSCVEEQAFRPSNFADNGARTTIKQDLEFVGEDAIVKKTESTKGTEFKISDLLYKHHSEIEKNSLQKQEVIKLLKASHEKKEQEIQIDSAANFAKLVLTMKPLSKAELDEVMKSIIQEFPKNNNVDRTLKMFRDALPLLGTTAAVSLMKDTIIEGKISALEENIWFSSLAFLQNPTLEMISTLKVFVGENENRKQAYLGITSLINQYCKSNPNCAETAEVKEIERLLKDKLNGNCRITDKTGSSEILTILKAIGNAGPFLNVVPTLTSCLTSTDNSMEIRIAAIEAFRLIDCTADRSALMKIMEDANLDSELRIGAYLAVMKCSDRNLIDKVSQILKTEQVNQFASFVWTHLQNLRETSSPLKQDVKKILEDKTLNTTFASDKLQFSKNIEKSFFLPSINLGAQVESNLIWSQKSFVPRSAMLNFTMDLYGDSFNFLEINARVEGLEPLLEKYFGPEGYFKQNGKTEKASSVAKVNEKTVQTFENNYKIEKEQLKALFGIKIFGHEISFLQLMENDAKINFNAIDLLRMLSNEQSVSINKNLMFLDTTFDLPTTLGLPLKLSTSGTAVVNMIAKGKLGVTNLFSLAPSVDFLSDIEPSAAIELNSMMGIDAFYSRHGVKMASNVYTSTKMNAKFVLKGNEQFKLEFETPKEEQKILSTSTKFYIINGKSEREQVPSDASVKRSKYKVCSPESVTTVLGMELCATYDVPVMSENSNIAFFTSPMSASVYLTKKDKHTSYLFSATHETKKVLIGDREYTSRFIKLLIDTPGSSTNRKFLTDFGLNFETNEIKLDFITPWKKFSLDGAIANRKDLKKIFLKFFMDDRNLFNLNGELNLKTEERKRLYASILELNIPGLPLINLKSTLELDAEKMNFDFYLENLLRSPLKIHSSVENVAPGNAKILTHHNAIFEITSHFLNSQFNYNRIKQSDNSVGWTITGDYSYKANEKHEIKCYQKITPKDSQLRRWELIEELRMSQYPEYNYKTTIEYELSPNEYSSKFQVEYGKDLTLLVEGEIKSVTTSQGVEANYYIFYPSYNVKYSGLYKFTYEHRKGGELLFLQKYGDNEVIKIVAETKIVESTRDDTIIRTNTMKSFIYGRPALSWDINVESLRSYRIESHQFKVDAVYYGKRVTTLATSIINGETKEWKTQGNVTINDVPTYNWTGSLVTNIFSPQLNAKISTAKEQLFSISAFYKIENKQDLNIGYGLELDGITFKKLTSSGEFSLNRLAGYKLKLKGTLGDGVVDIKFVSLESSYKYKTNGNEINREFVLSLSGPSKTVGTKVNIDIDKLKFQGRLLLELPQGKNVELIAMYDIDDGWTEKSLIASIALKTPWKRFPNTRISVNLNGQLNYRKAEIEISWGVDNKRIFTSLVVEPKSSDDMSGTLKIITPFPKFSYTKFYLKHLITAKEFTSNVKAELNNKAVHMGVRAVSDTNGPQKSLNFNANLKTPLEILPELTFIVDHKNDGKEITSDLTLKWEPDKQVSLKFSTNNQITDGSRYESDGLLKYETPFKGYEEGQLKWQHTLTPKSLKSYTELTYVPEKSFTLEIMGIKDTFGESGRRVSGKFSLKTPFTEEFKGDVEHSHKYERNYFECKTKVIFTTSTKDYSIEKSFTLSPKNIDLSITVQTPFAIAQNTNLEFHSKILENQLNAQANINYNNNPLASLKVDVKNTRLGELDFVITFTSTKLGNLNNIIISHNHEYQNFKLKSFSSLSIDETEFTVENEISWKQNVKFLSTVKTTSSAFRSLKMQIESDKFTTLLFSVNCNDMIKVAGNLERIDPTRFVGELQAEWGSHLYKLKMSHKFNLENNPELFEAFLTILEKERNLLNIEARHVKVDELKYERLINILYRENNVFEARQTAQYLTHFAGRSADIHTVLKLNNLKVTLEHFVSLKTSSDISHMIKIKTPYEKLSQASVMVKYLKVDRKCEVSLSGEYNNQRIDLQSTFEKQSPFKRTMEFSIKTPFKNFQEFSGIITNDGEFPAISHSHSLKLRKYDKEYELKNQLDLLGYRYINIESSYTKIQQLTETTNFKFLFDNAYKKFEVSSSLQLNKEATYAASLKYLISGTEKDIKIMLKTPFSILNRIELSFTLEGKPWTNKYKHQVVMAFENEAFKLALENGLDFKVPNYVDAFFRMKTPSKKLENFEAAYHHEWFPRSKKFSVGGHLNDKKMLVLADINVNTDDVLSVEFTLKTPFKGYTSMTIKGSLSGIDRKSSLKMRGNLAYLHPDKYVNVELKIKSNGRLLQINRIVELLYNEETILKFDYTYNHHMGNSKKVTWTANLFSTAFPHMPQNSDPHITLIVESEQEPTEKSLKIELKTFYPKAKYQYISAKYVLPNFQSNRLVGLLKLDGSYDQKSGSLNIAYNFDFEKTIGKSKVSMPLLDISLNFPYRDDLKFVRFNVTFNREDDYLQYVEAQLTHDKLLSKPWNLKLQQVLDKDYKQQFDVIASTSLKQMENLRITFKPLFALFDYAIELSVNLNQQQIFDLGTLLKVSKNTFEFNTNLNCKYADFDFKLSQKAENPAKMESSLKLSSSYLTSPIIASLAIKKNPVYQVEFDLKSPFVKATMVNSFKDQTNQNTLTLETNYGKIQCDSKFIIKTNKLEFSTSMFSTYSNVKKIEFGLAYEFDNSDHSRYIKSKLTADNVEQYNFIGKIKLLNSKLKTEMTLKSRFTKLADIFIDIEADWSNNGFNVSFNRISHNLWSKDIVGFLVWKSPSRFMQLKLETPFTGKMLILSILEKFELTVQINPTEHYGYTLNSDLKFDKYYLKTDLTLDISSDRIYYFGKQSTNVPTAPFYNKYGEEEWVSFSLQRNYPFNLYLKHKSLSKTRKTSKLITDIEFNCSLAKNCKFFLETIHSKSLKKIDFEIAAKPNVTIKFNLVRVDSKNDIDFVASADFVKTKFIAFSRLVVPNKNLNFDLSFSKPFSMNLTLITNGFIGPIDLKLTTQAKDEVTINLDLKTTFSWMRQVKTDFTFNSLKYLNFKLSHNKLEKDIKLTSTWKPYDFSASLETPFEVVKKLQASVTYSRPLNFNMKLSYNKWEKDIQIKIEQGRDSNYNFVKKLIFTMETPFEVMKSCEMKFMFLNLFNFNLSISHNKLQSPIVFENKEEIGESKLKLLVKLETPFEIVKKFKLEGKFEKSPPKNFNCTLSLSHNKLEKEIFVNLARSGDSLGNITLDLETPFELAKNLKIQLATWPSPRSLSFFLNHNKLRKPFDIYLHLKDFKSLGVKVKTPFEVIENFELSIERPDETKFTFELSHNKLAQPIKVNIEKETSKLTILGQSPFEYIKYINIILKFYPPFSLDLQISHNKLDKDITLSVKGEGKKFLEKASLNLETPFEFMKKISMSLTLPILKGDKLDFLFSHNYFKEDITIKAKGAFDDHFVLTVTTPFEVLRKLTVETNLQIEKTEAQVTMTYDATISHNLLPSDITLKLSLLRANNQSLSVKEMKFQVQTPYEAYNKFSGTLKVTEDFNSYSKAYMLNIIDHKLNKEIVIDYQINMATMSLLIRSPFVVLQEVKMFLSFINIPTNPSITIKFSHNYLPSDFNFNFNLKRDIKDTYLVEISLQTPFENVMKNIKFVAKHSFRSHDTTYISSATLECFPDKKFEFGTTYSFTRYGAKAAFDLKTPYTSVNYCTGSVTISLTDKVEVNFQGNHNLLKSPITMNIQFSNEKAGKVQFTLDTPFEGFIKMINFTTEYSFLNSIYIDSKLSYHPNRNYMLSLLLDPKNTKANFEIQTPFETLKQVYGTLVMKFNDKIEFNLELFHNFMPRNIKFSLNVDLPGTRVEEKRFIFILETPLKKFARKTELNGFYANGPDRYAIFTKFLLDSEIKFDLGFDIVNGESILKLVTPYELMKTVSMKVKFVDNESTGSLISLQLSHNLLEKDISAITTLKQTSQLEYEIKYKIATPFSILQESTGVSSITFARTLVLQKIKFSLTHNLLAQDISGEFIFNNNPSDKQIKIQMNTQWTGGVEMLGILKTDNYRNFFQGEWIQSGETLLTTQLEVSTDPSDIFANLSMTTPFDSMKQLTTSFRLAQQMNDCNYENLVHFSLTQPSIIDTKPLEITIKSKISSCSPSKLNLNVAAQLRKLYKLNFAMTQENQKVEFLISADADNQQYFKLQSEIVYKSRTDFGVSAEFQTSASDTYSTTAAYIFDGKILYNLFETRCPLFEPIKFEMEIDVIDIIGKVNLKSALTDLNSLSFAQKRELGKHESELLIVFRNEERIKFSTLYSFFDNTVVRQLNLITPFKNIPKMSISLKTISQADTQSIILESDLPLIGKITLKNLCTTKMPYMLETTLITEFENMKESKIKISFENSHENELKINLSGTALTVPIVLNLKWTPLYNLKAKVLEFEVKSPFNIMKQINGKAEYLLGNDEFVWKWQLNGEGVGESSASVVIAWRNKCSVLLKVTTPFDLIKSLVLQFEHQKSLPNKIIDSASVNIDGKEFGLETITILQPFSFKLGVITPFKDYERTEVSGTLLDIKNNFNGKFDASFGKNGNVQFVAKSDDKSQDFNFTSSFSLLKTLQVRLRRIDQDGGKLRNTYEISAGDNFNILATTKSSKEDIDGDLQILTTFDNFKKLSLQMSLKKDPQVPEIIFKGNFFNKYNMESILRKESNPLKYNFDIKLGTQGENSFSLTTEVNLSEKKSLKVLVKSPYRNFHTFLLEAQHSGTVYNHEQSLKIEINEKYKTGYESNVQIHSLSKLKTLHRVYLPLLQLQQASIETELVPGSATWKLNIRRYDQDATYHIISEHALQLSEQNKAMQIQLKMQLPGILSHVKEFTGALSITGVPSEFLASSMISMKTMSDLQLVPLIDTTLSYKKKELLDLKIAVMDNVWIYKGSRKSSELLLDGTLYSAVVQFNDQKVAVTMDYNNKEMELTIDQSIKPTLPKVYFKGKLDVLKSNAKELLILLKLNQKIVLSLASKYKKENEISNMIEFQGRISDTETNLVLQYQPNKMIIQLNTPFETFKTTNFQILQEQSKHLSSLKINDESIYELDLAYDIKKSTSVTYKLYIAKFMSSSLSGFINYDQKEIHIQVKLPMQSVNAVDLKINSSGDNLALSKLQMSLFINNKECISSKWKFSSDESSVSVSLNNNQGQEKMEVTVSQKNNSNKKLAISLGIGNRNYKVEMERENQDNAASNSIYFTTVQEGVSYIYGYKVSSERKPTGEAALNVLIKFLEREVYAKISKLVNDKTIKSSFHLNWDLARDVNKKIGWSLVMEKLERNTYKMRLTFIHPLATNDVYLDSVMKVNTGKTILLLESDLKYTNDQNDNIQSKFEFFEDDNGRYNAQVLVTQKTTGIDLKSDTTLLLKNSVYSMEQTTTYLDAENQVMKFNFRVFVDLNKKIFVLESAHPTPISFIGTLKPSKLGYEVTFTVTQNNENKLKGLLNIEKSPSLNMKIYDNTKTRAGQITTEVSASYINDNHFEFEVFRSNLSNKVPDFLLTIKLKSEHLLNSRMYWRPAAYYDFKDYISTQLRSLFSKSDGYLTKMKQKIAKDLNTKVNKVLATTPDYSSLVTYSRKEWASFLEDFSKVCSQVKKLFFSNTHFRRAFELSTVAVKETVEETKQRIKRFVLTTVQPIENAVQNLETLIANFVKATILSSKNNEYVVKAVTLVKPTIDSVLYSAVYLERNIAVVTFRFGLLIAKINYKVNEKITELLSQDYTELFSHLHHGLRQKLIAIKADLLNLFTKYTNFIQNCKAKLENYILNFGGNDRTILKTYKLEQVINWAYKIFNVEETMKQFINTQYQQAIDYLTEDPSYWLKQIRLFTDNKVIVYEPDQGKLEAELYLPVRFNNLRSYPDFSSVKEEIGKIVDKGDKKFTTVFEKQRGRIPTIDAIKSVVYSQMPYISDWHPKVWIPNFKAFGAISNRHVITFDKAHFDLLETDCESVLSADFKSQAWAMILNQPSTSERRYRLEVYGKQIELLENSQILVNKLVVELPYVLNSLVLTVEGTVLKGKDNLLGISFMYQPAEKLFVFGVSGWYHNKVGGLFGNYDNEYYNDFVTSQRKVTQDLSKYVQSWSLKTCKKLNVYASIQQATNNMNGKTCNFFFKSPMSKLRPCFKHIDATQFHTMCLEDLLNSTKINSKHPICNAVNAYVMQCRAMSIPVEIPPQCGQCYMPGDKPLNINDKFQVSPKNDDKKVDIVFVVDEGKCNKDIPSRLLSLIGSIDSAEKKTSKRYGLVGYGNKNLFPSTKSRMYTINSAPFGIKAPTLPPAVRNLNTHIDSQNNAEAGDMLHALQRASEYPFLPTAARHIVLIPCSQCASSQKLDALTLQLREQNIVLHVITDELENFDRFNSLRVLSTTNTTIYTTQVPAGKPNVEKSLITSCSNSAWATNGNVFNYFALKEGHVEYKTKAQQLLAKLIFSSSIHPTKSECQCLNADDPKVMCKQV